MDRVILFPCYFRVAYCRIMYYYYYVLCVILRSLMFVLIMLLTVVYKAHPVRLRQRSKNHPVLPQIKE